MADEKETPEATDDAEKEEGGKGKKKKIIIFGAIGAVVLLVIIGIAAYFIFGGKSAGTSGASSGTAEHSGGDVTAEAAKATDKDSEKSDKKTENGSKDGQKKGEGSEGKSDKDEKAEEGKSGSGKDKDDSKIDMGHVVNLDPFNLNLGNPLENRYVRLSISLEVNNGEIETEVGKRKPQVRDAVISIVSRKTMEFLRSPDGKDALRKEIKDKINGYMSKPINRVFITDILIE